MMFYKNGSDDFLRQSGMDMRKLGSSLGYTLPSGTEGPKTKTAEEIAAENLANFLFWTKPPAPPKPDKNQPFGTATYNTIISNLKKAAQAFAILFDLGAMTVKQYEQKATEFRGLPKQDAFTGQMMLAEWTVASSAAFATFLQNKAAAKPKTTTIVAVDLDKAAKSASDKLKASLQPWAALLAKWQGMTQAEFDELEKNYEDGGLLDKYHADKLVAYIQKMLADPAPQGHTKEVLDEAFDLRDGLNPQHEWVLNTKGAWDNTVKSFKGSGSWSYASAVALRDAVKAELALAKQIQAKGLMPKLTAGSTAAAAAAAAAASLATVAKAAAAKKAADDAAIKKILADTDAYFATQIGQGLLTQTQADYDAMKATAKGAGDWTVASATAFQKQVYALPLKQVQPVYTPPPVYGGGGGGGGGSSTGFGEGMALFQSETPAAPPTAPAAVAPAAEKKSALPLLALLGAAAYALSK